MHLLFATSIVPDGALGSGYEIANAAIIEGLRRAGVRVTVLGFTWPGRPAADPRNTIVLGELDVRTDSASMQQKVRWLAGAMLSGLPVASAKLRVLSADALRALIRRAGPFDGYVLNAAPFAGAFDGVFDDLPAVLVAHNVEYRSAEENAAAAQGFQRFVYAREARTLKQIEAKLCAKARFIFTLAEEDRIALGVASDDRSAVLPLVTRPKPPALAERLIECDAALIGTWTWQPNRIGLDWFLGSVVPHLPADFTIRIAGHMPADVSSSHPGVSFVGRVPDAEQFVRTAAVVPLISQAGTGVQLKTIETFELGLPSVATRRSLRGIDFLPPNCVVEDDPKAFAAALVSAARDRRPAIDGAVFHRRQLKALDAAILHGLKSFGDAGAEVAA